MVETHILVNDAPSKHVVHHYTSPSAASSKADFEDHAREPHPSDIPVVLQEKLLSDFRTKMSHFFPFVIIPPDSTATELRQKCPFLVLACTVVACNSDADAQKALTQKLLNYLGQHMLAESEKSLDLLQGLLVFIIWYRRSQGLRCADPNCVQGNP